MPDCDYCSETFDDEEAYLDHLSEAHEGELSRIDRRRVEDHVSDGGTSQGVVVAAVLGIVVVGGLAAVFLLDGGGGASGSAPPLNVSGEDVPENIESQSLPDRGDSEVISNVERFPDRGQRHVSNPSYDRLPPLSGPHAPQAAGAGFYQQTPSLGTLVHALEHGAVVIYYDDSRELNRSVRQSLTEFAENHRGTWSSVLIAPNPNPDPEARFVLTAWRHRLNMQEYNPLVVRAFLAEYLGRGPENPVR